MRPVLALLLLLVISSVGIAGGPNPSTHRSKSRSPKTATSESKSKNKTKTVHVRSYTRKDGTLVHAYDRRAPGTATDAASSRRPFKRDYLTEGYTAHPTVTRDSHGRIKRSKAARAAFMREHRCPSTGSGSGGCPGYVVDHVTPLECGGADSPSNMQWQTVTDAKVKDKTERYCR